MVMQTNRIEVRQLAEIIIKQRRLRGTTRNIFDVAD